MLTPLRFAAIVVFLLLGATGFLPLFGGPGYEHSIASGVVVPAAAAIAASVDLSSREGIAPLACVARGIVAGASLAGVALLTALLHGLRAGICDLAGGVVFFVLTAGFGALVGGVWGALVAERARARKRRRLVCVLLSMAAPAAGIAVSVARFYSSPMIFAYDPFFGFFSGALYDTVIDVRTELWTYRAGSLATLAGAALVASAMMRNKQGSLVFRPLRGGPQAQRAAANLALGMACLLASLAMSAQGPKLGHWQTAQSIARTLGGRVSGQRCDVVFPDSLLPHQSALVLQDCEQQLAADEARLGTKLDGRITAFVFRDAEDKRRLMGAAQTSIAKPWRREVYVQMSAYPHPVLGHEIAHVVSGSFARGPLRVAGALGGLWPNPGLIEGIAVATSPDDDELADAQWARAMLDLGILPRMRDLFSLGFLGDNASKSYTAAGAFVAWLIDARGAAVVRAWYGGDDPERLTGQGWDALDDSFRAYLRTLAMPDEASAYARAKFERPSVWSRRCPHVVDALAREADECAAQHRVERALALWRDVLARDPRDPRARVAGAKLDLWYADAARGREQLERAAADDSVPRTWRDRAREAIADDDLVHDRDDRAAAEYRAIAARSLDEDQARTLEVKALSVGNPPARRAVVDLLIGEPRLPVDSWLGAFSLGDWAAETHEPLAAYLVGKNLVQHGDPARAAPWLDWAIDAGVPTPRIARELFRQRAIAACVQRDADALDRIGARIDAPGSPFAGSSGGRKEWLERLIARCRP